jgi:hypothetical protein
MRTLAQLSKPGDLDAWDDTPAAEGFNPLPAGKYVCVADHGERTTSRSGNQSYKVTFKVLEGPHEGRRVWLDLWLTAPAMSYTKRDLAKFDIIDKAQLDRPIPPGRKCEVDVVQRTGNTGSIFNEVRRFDVVGRVEPVRDAFAPADEQPSAPAPQPAAPKPLAPTTDQSFDFDSFVEAMRLTDAEKQKIIHDYIRSRSEAA